MPAEKLYALSGADAFFLALEKHQEHNVELDQYCLYLIEIDGKLDLKNIKERLNDPILNSINSWEIKGRKQFASPRWIRPENDLPIEIIACPDIQNHFLHTQYELAVNISSPKSNGHIALIYTYNENRNSTTLILKWNHLIMDGMGAWLFLKYITQNGPLEHKNFFPKKDELNFKVWSLYKLVRFISNTSIKPVFIPSIKEDYNIDTCSEVLYFNEVESEKIRNLSAELGSALGIANYFLAKIITVLHDQNPNQPGDFWVPIPLNIRKKGAKGPVFSNQLSSYFFRIRREISDDAKAIVRSLNEQMKGQLLLHYPSLYNSLTVWMRYIPVAISYLMIRGWKRKNYASFLFTMAHPHSEIDMIEDKKVIDALSYPPNSYPPGLSFAVMQFNGNFRIGILSRKGILNRETIASLAENLRIKLLEH